MTKKKDELKNVAASVRDRLKKIADKSGEDFNGLLIRYAICHGRSERPAEWAV